jgi:membrane-bound lytic murein transglycosylase MltF
MKSPLKIFIALSILSLVIPCRLSFSTVCKTKCVVCKIAGVQLLESDKKLAYFVRGLEYRNIVFNKSKEHGIDWRLIMGMIEQESKFSENAVSNKGAQGLMQLMPNTQMDIAEKINDGFNPHGNIDMGINYYAKLNKLFGRSTQEDQTSLTLAAYNAGPSRIYDAQDIAAYLGEDPFSWRAIQNALPLLSKRFHTLHQSIWDGGKPRNGYFGSWRQTIFYVKSVLKYRNEINQDGLPAEKL